MGRLIRQKEIRRRRKRASQLDRLRARFAKARTESERSQLLAKAARVAPTLTPEQFRASVKGPT